MKRLLFASLCLLLCSCQKNAPSAAQPEASRPAAAPANSFAGLVGNWRRTDAEYLISIKSVATDGKADAAYFNPSPIHVSWALVKATDAILSLELELRDQNYPGCLYKLTTTPTPGVLSGTYYQAMTQMTYPVTFVREP